MYKKYIFLFFLLLFTGNIFAQVMDEEEDAPKRNSGPELPHYKMGIGLRLAFDLGLTYKQFIAEKTFYEVSLSHRFIDYGGEKVVFMYGRQIQNTWDAILIPHISWFYGIGASIAYYAVNSYPIGGKGGFYPTRVTPFGINAIIGAEYRFQHLPLALSVDIRPYYEFYKPGPYYSDEEVTIRYIIP